MDEPAGNEVAKASDAAYKGFYEVRPIGTGVTLACGTGLTLSPGPRSGKYPTSRSFMRSSSRTCSRLGRTYGACCGRGREGNRAVRAALKPVAAASHAVLHRSEQSFR